MNMMALSIPLLSLFSFYILQNSDSSPIARQEHRSESRENSRDFNRHPNYDRYPQAGRVYRGNVNINTGEQTPTYTPYSNDQTYQDNLYNQESGQSQQQN